MKIIKLYLIILVIESCTPMARILIGYKTPQQVSNKQILDLAKKLKIEDFPIYYLDTTYFDNIRLIFDDKNSRKIFNQPIMLYFFKNDSLKSFTNNCAYPGVPKLKWNYFGHFDKYPPGTNYNEKTFNKLLLIDIVKNIHPVKNDKKMNNNDEYIFIMFNNTFYRQTKELIKIIEKNYSNYKDHIIFINNDSYIYNKFEYGF